MRGALPANASIPGNLSFPQSQAPPARFSPQTGEVCSGGLWGRSSETPDPIPSNLSFQPCALFSRSSRSSAGAGGGSDYDVRVRTGPPNDT